MTKEPLFADRESREQYLAWKAKYDAADPETQARMKEETHKNFHEAFSKTVAAIKAELSRDDLLKITPSSIALNPGDTFVMKGKSFDDRNWWRRHAPSWLGGLPDPTKDQTLIVQSVTSGATFIEGNPLCLTPDLRHRVQGTDQ